MYAQRVIFWVLECMLKVLPAASIPNDMQKKTIIALTVAAGVDFVFANHCY